MHKTGEFLQLSASDLVGHLNCRHLTNLDLDAIAGKLVRPHFHNPLLEILIERGGQHERNYLDHLADKDFELVHIDGSGVTRALVDQTLDAMRRGAQIIAQAALINGRWAGRADILMRVEKPSALGAWSYEPIDTKLARETKAGTVLQLSLYADLLTQTQGTNPELMYVVTPGSGFAPEQYRTADYAAYYRYVLRRLEQSLEPAALVQTYPDPVEHCEVCNWRTLCDAKRRADDHLCLVASISKLQVDELKRRGIDTTAKLARLPVPLTWKPDRGAKQSFERAREQARVQVQGRESNQPIFECLPPEPGLGLSRLPAPSAGDLFLDLEADPFVAEGGLEYLFGFLSLTSAGEGAYLEDWALTREEERRAFERLVDFIMARWAVHPDMHVYHYSAYEPSALKRLMGRYASREDEIDRMLRGGVFVDLYAIVRHAIRASVESYSIKDLEPFYTFQRTVDLAAARKALAAIQGSLELNDGAGITDDIKRTIAAYNRGDCASALRLRDWLEQVRARLVAEGADIARPTPKSPEPNAELTERQRQLAELVQRLTADVPADKTARTPDQHARWILAYTLDWHRRELKSTYWERYRLQDLVDRRSR